MRYFVIFLASLLMCIIAFNLGLEAGRKQLSNELAGGREVEAFGAVIGRIR